MAIAAIAYLLVTAPAAAQEPAPPADASGAPPVSTAAPPSSAMAPPAPMVAAAPAAAPPPATLGPASSAPPASYPVGVPQPRFALGLERAGGLSYSTLTAKESDAGGGSLTAFNLGGAVANPLSAPRLAGDYLFSSGLTLGAAFSVFTGGVTYDDPDSESTRLGGASGWLLQPRIGWRFKLSDRFDLTPRFGIAFSRHSFRFADERRARPDPATGRTDFVTIDGDEVGASLVSATLEGVAAARLTSSLNLLGGVSIDSVVGATLDETQSTGESGTRTREYDDEIDRLLSASLWIGLGGYL